jgi:hypothetical protein
MNTDDAIGQLGHMLGFKLKLDRNRVCAVVFDDQLTVEFEAPPSAAHALVMTCRVAGRVPVEQREEVYALLLQANLFGRGTAGAALAIDQTREEIVLQRTLWLDQVDFQDLMNALESLLQYGLAWVERLMAFNAARAPRLEGSLSAYSTMLRI